MPPISANGTLSRISDALLDRLERVEKQNENQQDRLMGTITASRAMARCWFSNSPHQVTMYPGGQLDLLRTRACMSATTLPMSRPSMNTPIGGDARAVLAADVHAAARSS